MPADGQVETDISLATLAEGGNDIPDERVAEAARRVLSRLPSERTVVRAADLETIDPFLEGIAEPDIAVLVASAGGIEVLDDGGTLIFAREGYADDIALDFLFEERFTAGLGAVGNAGTAVLGPLMAQAGGDGGMAALAEEWGQDADDLRAELLTALGEVDRGGRGIVSELSALVREAIDGGDSPADLRERADALEWASVGLIGALDAFARTGAEPREWRTVARASSTASTEASEREAIKRVRAMADALVSKRPTKSDRDLANAITKPMTIKQIAAAAKVATAQAMQALVRLQAAGAVSVQADERPVRYVRAD